LDRTTDHYGPVSGHLATHEGAQSACAFAPPRHDQDLTARVRWAAPEFLGSTLGRHPPDACCNGPPTGRAWRKPVV